MLGIGLPCRCYVAAMVLVALAPMSSPFPGVKTVPDALPRSWSLEEISKAAPPYGAEGRVYVLAWTVVEDSRPLRVESCLVLKILNEESENGRWCLAHLYRHPVDQKAKWRLSLTHVSGEPGTKYFLGVDLFHAKRFDEKPGNKELYAALAFEEVNWNFELEKGWTVVGCGVCERSWQEAVGEKPTRFFKR
jgi:hypothetical protein